MSRYGFILGKKEEWRKAHTRREEKEGKYGFGVFIVFSEIFVVSSISFDLRKMRVTFFAGRFFPFYRCSMSIVNSTKINSKQIAESVRHRKDKREKKSTSNLYRLPDGKGNCSRKRKKNTTVILLFSHTKKHLINRAKCPLKRERR